MITQKGTALPPILAESLQSEPTAIAAFEALRPSCQRRYAAWVETAKRAETRERRAKRAVEMALEWKMRRKSKGSSTLAGKLPE